MSDINAILATGLGNALAQGASAAHANAETDRLRGEEKRRLAIQPDIAPALKGDMDAFGRVVAADPQRGAVVAQALDRMDVHQRTKAKEATDYAFQTGMGILNAPPESQPQLYAQARADAQAKGMDISKWPQTYDPGWLKFNVDKMQPAVEYFKNQDNKPVPGPPAGGGTTRAALPPEWDPHFQAGADKSGIPVPVLRAVAATESGGNASAVSPAGARGPMQFMPGTAADMGVTNPHDPAQSIPAGAAYLRQNLDKYNGNPTLTLMAYNWGPGNVDKWIKDGSDPNKVPAETRAYVQKVQSQIPQAGGQAPAGGPPVAPQGQPPAAGGADPKETVRGLKLPQGSRVMLLHGVPIVKDGSVFVVHADGTPDMVPLPPRKEPQTVSGPFAGTGMEQQASNILLTGDPASPEYATAYAHMKAPRTTVNETGQMVTIQPDVSHFRPPVIAQTQAPQGMPTVNPGLPQGTPGTVSPAGGMPGSPPQPGAAPPAVIAQLPGGQTATVTQGRGHPIPATENEKLSAGVSLVNTIDKAIETYKNPTADNQPSGRVSGFIARNGGQIGDLIAQETDPAGVKSRAAIADVNSQLLLARSGAAVTEGEYKRLVSLLPAFSDNPDVIIQKLEQVRSTYAGILKNSAAQYTRENGFIPHEGAQAVIAGDQAKAKQAPKAGADRERLLFDARKAIDAGAPKDKVLQRLKENGIEGGL